MSRDKACVRPGNHSYRYGDGLFETMKVVKEKILLGDLHFERLYNSLTVLKFVIPALFTRQKLEQEIVALCKRNRCEDLARVRVSVSGGHGGLYDGDEKLYYIIECWPLGKNNMVLNENGLIIDVFSVAKKTCDVYSSLKSASHLLYVMAARFAKENKLNDCLVLNTHERPCDATIANVFWTNDKTIFTPPLSEGCIAGVMRKNLIQKLGVAGYKPQEKICEAVDLENADEIFLTNAISGIRWVKQFRNKNYTRDLTREIYYEVLTLEK